MLLFLKKLFVASIFVTVVFGVTSFVVEASIPIITHVEMECLDKEREVYQAISRITREGSKDLKNTIVWDRDHVVFDCEHEVFVPQSFIVFSNGKIVFEHQQQRLLVLDTQRGVMDDFVPENFSGNPQDLSISNFIRFADGYTEQYAIIGHITPKRTPLC